MSYKKYLFTRRFSPNRLTLHSSNSFYILSVLAFPGNQTHDLVIASAMLYQVSYRKAVKYVSLKHGIYSAIYKMYNMNSDNKYIFRNIVIIFA